MLKKLKLDVGKTKKKMCEQNGNVNKEIEDLKRNKQTKKKNPLDLKGPRTKMKKSD